MSIQQIIKQQRELAEQQQALDASLVVQMETISKQTQVLKEAIVAFENAKTTESIEPLLKAIETAFYDMVYIEEAAEQPVARKRSPNKSKEELFRIKAEKILTTEWREKHANTPGADRNRIPNALIPQKNEYVAKHLETKIKQLEKEAAEKSAKKAKK
jgi:hypothetical protein